MTRSDSKRFRMELLEYMSKTLGLVTGSETGHDAAVPYVHYFEGMLSLGPYRVPDSGRDMLRAWKEVPELVAKFQTGHTYRLPLWELVYHDCVVAQWYWGDYNNKLPAVWRRRDLLNALYGTPPMFMFNREIWRENRDRFVESYRTATPVARATGYSEMVSHRWLTADHSVQETEFANGVVVTVNFGDSSFAMPDGSVLEPIVAARGRESRHPTRNDATLSGNAVTHWLAGKRRVDSPLGDVLVDLIRGRRFLAGSSAARTVGARILEPWLRCGHRSHHRSTTWVPSTTTWVTTRGSSRCRARSPATAVH